MIHLKKIISNLHDFENSEFLRSAKYVIDTGHQIMDKIDEFHHIEPITIEQLIDKLSPSIDKEIIKHHQKNLKPIGGELKLSIQENHSILAVWEFYFTNEYNSYHKIGGNKTIEPSWLIDDDYQKIKSKPLTFEITQPQLWD